MNDKIESLIKCPFCGEDDFDLIGLKYHIAQGQCEPYNNTKDLPELYNKKKLTTPTGEKE